MLVAVVTLLVIVLGTLVLLARYYRKAPVGSALIVTTGRGLVVARGGMLVLPIVNSAETIDLRAKVLRVERKGRDALPTKDDVRVELDVCVTIRVGDTSEDVLRVAKDIGCAAMGDEAELARRFAPTIESVLGNVVHNVTVEDLLGQRSEVEDKIANELSDGFGGGMRVDRVAIERVERAPARTKTP